MKYKVYFKGSLCNVFDDESRDFNLNMIRQSLVTSCLVETGGIIDLPNGDTLHINAEYGIIGGEYAPGEEGIEVYLESGNYFQLFYIVPDDDSAMSSSNGVFFSFSDCGVWNEYSVGSMLRIYTWNDSRDWYEICGNDFQEPKFSSVNAYTIVIDDSDDAPRWTLVNDTKYVGNTVVTPNELIFVSSLSCVSMPEAGIWFTRQSGEDCFAFYKRDGDVINETAYFWFGLTGMPQENDEIVIYSYSDDYNDWNDYTEETIAENCEKLYTLIFDGQKWIDKEHSTCSVEEGGTIILSNDDILYINEKMGQLSEYPNYYGIELSLNSGNHFLMFLHLVQPIYTNTIIESGFGILYDYPEEGLYREGNILKVYVLPNGETYDNFEDVARCIIQSQYTTAEELLEDEYGIYPEEIEITNNSWVLH